MKTHLISLFVALLLSGTMSMAQDKITVEAQSDDISNNLDLQAVASVFAESKDLQDFEMRLNDYDSRISNLDMNNDGEVDYLRVIENNENNVHLVVIQAVLDVDVYQDVATIVVERNAENNKTYVQVIGDPYIYGADYIIEPVFLYRPSIFSFFWGPGYYSWRSPYYWGYYPHWYHHFHPYPTHHYLSYIDGHINHNHHYYYTDRMRNRNVERMHNSIRRNDFQTRYPDRSFNSRNQSFRNKQEVMSRTDGGSRALQMRSSNPRSESMREGRSAAGNMSRNQNQGYQATRGTGDRTNSSTVQRSRNINDNDEIYQSRSSRSNNQNQGFFRSQQSSRGSNQPSVSTRSNSSEMNRSNHGSSFMQRERSSGSGAPSRPSIQPRQNNSQPVRVESSRSSQSGSRSSQSGSRSSQQSSSGSSRSSQQDSRR